jgi:cellulose synthase operon protein C
MVKEKSFISSNKAEASNNSVAIVGDNNAPITIGNGLSDQQTQEILAAIHKQGETRVNDKVDSVANQQIDSIAELIKNGQTVTAKKLLVNMHEKAADYSNKILFRIKANIGICEYLEEHYNDAARLLLEAYEYAPEEPKAKTNKALAFLLQNKAKDCFEFAKEELEKNPDNADLAGILVQAASPLAEINDPIDFVPESLKESSAVYLGLILFYVSRGMLENSSKVSSRAAVLFPESREIVYFNALNNLELVFNSKRFQFSHMLSDSEFQTLKESHQVFKEKWTTFYKSELRLNSGPISVLTNLCLLNSFFHHDNDSKEVIKQAVDKAKGDSEFLIQIVNIALNTHDIDLIEFITVLIPSENITAFLSFRIAEIKQSNDYFVGIDENEILSFPEAEQIVSRIIIYVAKLIDKGKVTEADFKQLLHLAENDVRALSVIASGFLKAGNKIFFDAAYQKALENVNGSTLCISRLMLSQLSWVRREWKSLIDLLDGYIPTQVDSIDLYRLAVAHTNINPVQERAISFFKNLPRSISKKPEFLRLQAILYFNQFNCDLSEKFCEEVIQHDENDLFIFMLLSQIKLVKCKTDELMKLLQNVDPYAMQGDPLLQIDLAQLIGKYCDMERAVAFGYKSLSENHANPKVIQKYIGLLMIVDEKYQIPESTTVAKGYCIELINQFGEKFEFLFDDDIPWAHMERLSANHEIVRGVEGLSLGDTFEQQLKFSNPITWTVKQIKHKYLHALHLNMNTFQARFPEEPFFRLKLPESESIDELLEFIKKDSKKDDELIKKYHQNKIPLHILGKYLGGHNAIEVAETLISKKISIATNYENVDELKASIDKLLASSGITLVFDTYTIWHLAVLDLLPAFSKEFKLLVTASTRADLQLLLDKNKTRKAGDLSVSWVEGEFQKHERSEEYLVELCSYIEKKIEQIDQYCIIEHVAWPVNLSENVNELIKFAGSHFLDAALLSTQSNALLVSEDLYFRQWSKFAFNEVNTIWLEPVFRCLNSRGLLSNVELSRGLLHLLAWNHSNIYLTISNLVDIYNFDDTDELLKFNLATKFLENPSDLTEHQDAFIVKAFLSEIWGAEGKDKLKLQKATTILLNKFLLKSSKKALNFLIICFDSIEEMDLFLIEWRESNHISDEEITQAYEEIIKIAADFN